MNAWNRGTTEVGGLCARSSSIMKSANAAARPAAPLVAGSPLTAAAAAAIAACCWSLFVFETSFEMSGSICKTPTSSRTSLSFTGSASSLS